MRISPVHDRCASFDEKVLLPIKVISRQTAVWRGIDLELGDPLPKPCYVILHVGIGPSQHEEKQGLALIVKDAERFALSDDIWIERLEEQTAKKVQKACEPPHYNIGGADYDRHLYAFIRWVPDGEARRYEGLETLHAVLALSRLIQPTSIGNRYCAQVFHYGRADSGIYAIQYRGISPDVFLNRKQRDWLTVEDGETLRGLTPWLSKDKNMHHRVHRAYWYHEYVMRFVSSLYMRILVNERNPPVRKILAAP